MDKRFLAIILILLCLISSCVLIVLFRLLFDAVLLDANRIVTDTPAALLDELIPEEQEDLPFSVFSDSQYAGGFKTLEEAVSFAGNLERAVVKEIGRDRILWDNLPPYLVYISNDKHTEYLTFADALEFAKAQERALIYHRKSFEVVWDNYTKHKSSHSIDKVEIIMQYPELPRGCEVTSLAMLLRYLGADTDKMRLAEEITKDTTPYAVKNGKTYFGNPNTGFVGSMTDMKKPGLGVYHGPVYDLAMKYFPDTAIDMTGCDLSDLYSFLAKDIPVWIIITSTFRKLPHSKFVTWQTESGELQITYSEHSVLVTGYDEQNIYFADPLTGAGSAKLRDFEASWIQMGRQAVTVSKR